MLSIAVIGDGTIGTAMTDAARRAGAPVVAAEEADVVVEAVPERLDVKRAVLRRAHEVSRPGAVLVTTTTALRVADLAAGCGRPSRLVGLHLPEPGSATVEIVVPGDAPPEVRGVVRELTDALGFTAVALEDRPGLVSGALQLGYLNAAVRMVEEGYASCESVDLAMALGCGLPRGPFAQLDLIGLDTARDTLAALYERTGDPLFRPAPTLSRLVADGRLGRKSGGGFRTEPSHGTGEAGAGHAGNGVRRVGVVGSGTMATGIAEVCVRAGHPVDLAARTREKAAAARAAILRSMDRAVRRGRLDPGDRDAAAARLTVHEKLTGVAGCDAVIEAVVEDAAVKRRIFAELDALCPDATMLATTTSSLSVLDCAAGTGRADRVVGLHFFNPAPVMRLVELATTAHTAHEVAATAEAFCHGLGKRAVRCGDRTGFIVNALLLPYLNRAARLLGSGYADAERIDTVMRDGCGYPMGPLRLLDTIGLDVSVAILASLRDSFGDEDLAPAPALRDLVAAGRLGRKTGAGFHAYERP
ncbi:3-hydroxyacyl-CoA dehydrogenase family protein [Dactylosporangium sp. CA-233914]|uniref:3-hydroxyacyl-CoA dehydrogenase family protein n=1 Tax=Dactylosporangium sp. CA-233914 TaxID=3239934 RepID=UPI003D8D4B1B